MPDSTDRRRELLRDLLGAVGWAVFIGGGIAMGLALGSVGADVPADGGMLWYLGLIVAVGTLVVRVAMVAWKYRGLAGGGTTPRAAATRAGGRANAGDDPDLEPVGAPPRKRTTTTGATATKRPAAKRPGASKPSGPKPGSSTRSSSSSTKKKPGSGGTKPRPKPRKKPNG